MADLTGARGLVVGVANKRSLAWAIAKAADAAGARLTLSYATDRFEKNARALAGTLRQPTRLVQCDVTRDDEVAALTAETDSHLDGLDFLVHAVAFATREAIAEPFVRTKRGDFAQSLDISAYSLVVLARAAAPLMERRGGGSILTLSYLGSERVFPHYNVMGVAKAALEANVRYLASDLGPAQHPGQRFVGGPHQDPRGVGHPGLQPHPGPLPRAGSARPHGGRGRGGRRRPVPARARRPRNHRRGAARRRRLPRHRDVGRRVRDRGTRPGTAAGTRAGRPALTRRVRSSPDAGHPRAKATSAAPVAPQSNPNPSESQLSHR